MSQYRKDLFRAALVNRDYKSRHAYAKAHDLSAVTVGKVWNGDTDITIDKLGEIIAPLGLTVADLFASEDIHSPEVVTGQSQLN